MINTEYLEKCIQTIEKSYKLLKESKEGTIDYEIYRNSLVKGFEMTIEQTGKLLRKKLAPYFGTRRALDELTYKDLFRHALKHSLVTEEEVVRWFKYRDNRNSTSHDYGQKFAEETLRLIEDFLNDVKRIKVVIDNG